MFGDEFFPTPPSVAAKMLAKISKDAENYLEPSAGKGDLAEAIMARHDTRWGRSNFKIDCIESNPELASVLCGKELPVVGFDWLTYTGISFYDAIVMNPPFSNGDDHLLKAWDFMHDGEIVCLLNEQTVLNPTTAARKRLVQIIADHGNVEYLGECFSTAQRKTDVRVAMVYLKKAAADDSIDLWAANPTEEKRVDENIGDKGEECMLAIRDNLGNMEHYYNMANEHMLKAFQHARKARVYMNANDIKGDHRSEHNYGSILAMALGNVNTARAEFARKHRRDAWFRVFEQMQFRKWLDKKQTEEFLRDVERNGNIPFTADNIKSTLENVILQRRKLFQQSCANVFDELCKFFKGNGNHTEGWKTNDSYKVNEKLIFPWGCHFDSQYCEKFELSYGYNSSVIDIYHDLDRVLCVLDGEDFDKCHTIGKALNTAFDRLGYHVKAPFNNTTESQYFEIKFWKKGTVHLKFKRREIWEAFNIAASAGKRWLGENTQGEPNARTPKPEPMKPAEPKRTDAEIQAEIEALRAEVEAKRMQQSTAAEAPRMVPVTDARGCTRYVTI
jgi:hypothetical protein